MRGWFVGFTKQRGIEMSLELRTSLEHGAQRKEAYPSDRAEMERKRAALGTCSCVLGFETVNVFKQLSRLLYVAYSLRDFVEQSKP